MKFKKKSVVVEAIQWTGENRTEIEQFIKPKLPWRTLNETLMIHTLEGVMRVSVGDWIIREPFPTNDRQFYPCKPDIFEATYEPVG